LSKLTTFDTQGACILTGLGFNGYDPKTGKTLWNRVSNVLIWNIETAQSYKVLFDSWNCGANVCIFVQGAMQCAHPTSQSIGLAQGHHLQACYTSRKKAGFRKYPHYLLDFRFLGKIFTATAHLILRLTVHDFYSMALPQATTVSLTLALS
jgi:hypothetical protein